MPSAAGEDGGWSSHSAPVKTKSRQEVVLGILIAFEIVLFSITGRNFLSLDNFFECIRLSAELGLLALAMTPVLITGGIDLSVGSMMGLAAVILGAARNHWHLPLGMSAGFALLSGCAGGSLNALAISRLALPPLIVTLGTFSM